MFPVYVIFSFKIKGVDNLVNILCVEHLTDYWTYGGIDEKVP